MNKEYDFNRAFKELSRIHDTSIVFNDWLSFSIDQFLINPDKKYFLHENYTEKEYQIFWRLFQSWIYEMDKALETHEWYDLLGVYYEENVKSSSKASDMGQFFTPHDVVDLMLELTIKDNAGTCYDPCGGSGRFLLAYHVKHPSDLCFCHDLDETACKMAVLNFLIHGVKGGVCRYNCLTGEFYNAWKINEVPFCIMEVDSMMESMVFIGEDYPCLRVDKINEGVVSVKEDCVVVGQASLEDYL